MTEAETIWDRLKYGVFRGSVLISFAGNGRATKFNSGWLSGARMISVYVDGVAKHIIDDFEIEWNDIIFKSPPAYDSHIAIKIHE